VGWRREGDDVALRHRASGRGGSSKEVASSCAAGGTPRDAAEAPDERTPETEVGRAHSRRRVLDALELLDEQKREVVVLHEIEQLPMREVAELVGCPLQTAYGRLYAAHRVLADHLRREP